MSGIGNRNLLYVRKLAIVLPVSSTLPKDGFKPAPCERAFFWKNVFPPKKKPAIDTDAGFPVFSHPSSRSGFLCSDNDPKILPCLHAAQHEKGKRKPAGLVAAGINPFQGRMEETIPILGALEAQRKSAKSLNPCRNALSLSGYRKGRWSHKPQRPR